MSDTQPRERQDSAAEPIQPGAQPVPAAQIATAVRAFPWRWPLFAVGLLVAAFATSKTLHSPTRVAAQLVAQKVSVDVSAAQAGALALTESIPVDTAFAYFVGVATITGARLQPPNEAAQEIIATEQQPLELRCEDANLQPSVRLLAAPANTPEQASLEVLPLHANPGEALALWTDVSNNLTLQMHTPAAAAPRAANAAAAPKRLPIVAELTASAPFQIEITHCKARLAGSERDLSGYTVTPEHEGCDIKIAADPRLTLVLAYAGRQPPPLLPQGALRVAALDLSSEHPTRGRHAALLADGALNYPDYPSMPALSLLRRNGIKFDKLDEFFVEELQIAPAHERLSPDAPAAQHALHVRLYGTANEIRERRPAGDGRDLRLTLFDKLAHNEWLHDALWIATGAVGVLASIFTILPRK